MAITVGLDFGTHQTKICIEDKSDRNTPRYEFFTFKDLSGKDRIILPSVIQINEDDTVSYGFVGEKPCKVDLKLKNYGSKPALPELITELDFPPKPKMPSVPPKPIRMIDKRTMSFKEQLKMADLINNPGRDYELIQWERKYRNLGKDYQKDLDTWEAECRSIEVKNKEINKKNQALLLEYYKDVSKWEEKKADKQKLIFRYFKQASFTSYPWPYFISAFNLSVWFLANILFDLEEKYGTDFSVQMGVPTGSANLEKKKEIASRLLLAAYHLVEDVFENDKEKFLNTKWQDLVEMTKIERYDKDKKDEFGILVFPEAYASLMALVQKGKLASGMNLLVDIGGGTTDISFFVVDARDMNPLIYNYESLDKGINYIVEQAYPDMRDKLEKKISLDTLPPDRLNRAVSIYEKELRNSCSKLIDGLHKAFKETLLDKIKLNSALQKRPIVFTGGGSTFELLRNEIAPFTDIRHFNGDFWRGMYVENAEQLNEMGLCPILSVALGLSVSKADDNIIIRSLDEIFKHLVKGNHTSYDYGRDYNLSDT